MWYCCLSFIPNIKPNLIYLGPEKVFSAYFINLDISCFSNEKQVELGKGNNEEKYFDRESDRFI